MAGGASAGTVFLCIGVIVGGLIFVIVFCAWCGTRNKRPSSSQTSYGFQLVQILSRGRGDTDNTQTTQTQQEPVTVTTSPVSPRTNQNEHSSRRSPESTYDIISRLIRENNRRNILTPVRHLAITAPPEITNGIANRISRDDNRRNVLTPVRPPAITAAPPSRLADNTEALPRSNAWTDIDLNAMVPSLSNPSTHLSAQHGPPRIAPFVPPPRRTRRSATQTEPTAPLLPPATQNEPGRPVLPAYRTEPTAPLLPPSTLNEPVWTVRQTNRGEFSVPLFPHTSHFRTPERGSINNFRNSDSLPSYQPSTHREIERFEHPEDLQSDPSAPPSYDEVMSKPHIYPKK